MYTAGHTGCWHFYYDGGKSYTSEDKLPYSMYWENRCCSEKREVDPKRKAMYMIRFDPEG